MNDKSATPVLDTPLTRQVKRLGLTDVASDWAERYLLCDQAVDPDKAPMRQRFEAVAKFVRDLLAHRWQRTRHERERANPKRIYYLSMEFLIGRMLNNNILNLLAEPMVRQALEREGLDIHELAELEPDAGLGNGGLGRLAACFIDSLATMQYSAIGYGLRYEYGIFKQSLHNGCQMEQPDNWLRRPDPWEVARPGKVVRVPVGATVQMHNGKLQAVPGATHLLGIAYDRPVVGYGARCINTLRLWAAAAPDSFDFAEFGHGDFVGAVLKKVAAESITRVLYPDDSTEAGRNLRFLQEYFLVCCSLHDIIARFRKTSHKDWHLLPDRVAIQLNDTHPSLAVAELMRILLEQAKLDWERAWDLTVRTLGYTNHTLLPEALEKWPVDLFERFFPRHLEIIYEINSRFLDQVRERFPGDIDRVQRMSLIEETPHKQVRMAHLAIVGTHSTNGVASIHSQLLRTRTVADFAAMFPERFSNKTNGVTPRRWLMLANPDLSRLITEALGDDSWATDLARLRGLLPLADDAAFRVSFRRAKHAAKARFANWLKTAGGHKVDPSTIFDCQIKRIHEYKRQLLNLLHVIVLYNRLCANPGLDMPPRTFFFAGKAAPAYHLAKLIIKLINNVSATVAAEPRVRQKLQVLFLPEYNVSLAERLIPASDVSEQISTAGFEASGTSNMKFMMNGALTVGTRDGATIEMAEEAGDENFFLFGLTAQQVLDSRGWYDPWWHYHNEPEIRQALDLIGSDHFSPREPGIFRPIWDTLLTQGDRYMHLADLSSYGQTHVRVADLYTDHAAWDRKAIINVACSGKFSSDRTIAEYAEHIWDAKPCPVT